MAQDVIIWARLAPRFNETEAAIEALEELLASEPNADVDSPKVSESLHKVKLLPIQPPVPPTKLPPAIRKEFDCQEAALRPTHSRPITHPLPTFQLHSKAC